MATNIGINFYSGVYGEETALAKATNGDIVFDKTSKSIYVDGVKYGSNIVDATFSNNKLTITKVDNTQVEFEIAEYATIGESKVNSNLAKSLLTIDNDNKLSISDTWDCGTFADV